MSLIPAKLDPVRVEIYACTNAVYSGYPCIYDYISITLS